MKIANNWNSLSKITHKFHTEIGEKIQTCLKVPFMCNSYKKLQNITTQYMKQNFVNIKRDSKLQLLNHFIH